MGTSCAGIRVTSSLDIVTSISQIEDVTELDGRNGDRPNSSLWTEKNGFTAVATR